MPELVELATLTFHRIHGEKVAARAREWAVSPDAPGELLGMWQPFVGDLGSVIMLRGFESASALEEERRRESMSADPFGCSDVLVRLSTECYAPFPFLGEIGPRSVGGFYEFRRYWLKPGGLPATLAGWENAIEPAREMTQYLVTAMYALDGPPRFVHIWAYPDLQTRTSARATCFGDGSWPPRGAAEHIARIKTLFADPQPDSPLR